MANDLPTTDEERWNQLFASIKVLTQGISDLKQQSLSSSQQLKSLENRMTNNEERTLSIFDSNRAKNIVNFAHLASRLL